MKKPKPVRVWVGFESGHPSREPLAYPYPETSGVCVAVFARKRDATVMYQDARQMLLVPVPPRRRKR